ncbi:MAG: PepSY domain-containing protein [Actinomycetota bacterium]
MDRKTRWIAGGALAVAVIGGGTGFALAAGGDDDKPLAGSTLDKATAAALEFTGGGTVVETEVGDDGAAYGVEIRLDDGSVVEVGLDASFNVIGQEGDDDGPGEDAGPNND